MYTGSTAWRGKAGFGWARHENQLTSSVGLHVSRGPTTRLKAAGIGGTGSAQYMPDLRRPARGMMTIRLLRQARRLAIIVIGFLFLAIGLVLAALPVIPGGVVGILVGLTILSTELEWARRLRTKVLAPGQRFLPRLFNRRPKDQASLRGARSAQEAGPLRRGRGGLPIVTIGLAVAAVLVALTLIAQTTWHP